MMRVGSLTWMMAAAAVAFGANTFAAETDLFQCQGKKYDVRIYRANTGDVMAKVTPAYSDGSEQAADDAAVGEYYVDDRGLVEAPRHLFRNHTGELRTFSSTHGEFEIWIDQEHVITSRLRDDRLYALLLVDGARGLNVYCKRLEPNESEGN